MKKFFTMFLVVLSLVLLTGCNSAKITVSEDQKTIEMLENGTVEVKPTYTEGTTLIWTSSNEDVAKVNNGIITAIKAGDATITITMKEHEDVSCEITVKVNKATSRIKGADEMLVGASETYEFVAGTEGAKATKWEIENPEIAKLEGTKVTGLKAGKTVIRVEFEENGKKGILTKEITVAETPVTGITVKYDKSMYVGKTQTIEVRVHPNDATNKNIKFESSNPAIATVNAEGLVEAKGDGLVDITVTPEGDPSKAEVAKIFIKKYQAEGIVVTCEKDSIGVDEQIQLKASITPDFMSQEVTWKVTPEKVATIDENGLLTGKAAGRATITATTKDGSDLSYELEIMIVEEIISSSIKVGKNEQVKSLAEAMLSIQDNTEILLVDDEYTEDFTIVKNGIKFRPAEDKKTPVKFDCVITFGEKVKGAKFENVVFGSNTAIAGVEAGGQEDITFNECTFDSTTADPSIGVMTFYGDVKGLVFTNNEVLNCRAGRFFRFKTAIVDLTIENSNFESGGGLYDWAYVDGYMAGDVRIVNNKFGKTLQSGFYIKNHDQGNFLIENNTFKNINNTAFDIRMLREGHAENPKMTFNVIHNTFDNTDVNTDLNWGCVRTRFKGYALTDITINFNYNIVINWNIVDILEDAGPQKFQQAIANCDNNYILGYTQEQMDSDTIIPEKDGKKFITGVKTFGGLAKSWKNTYTDIELLDADYAPTTIDRDPHALLVGKTTEYTKKPYETLAQALEAAQEGDTIYLLPGAHTGDVTINMSNIKITTLNGTKNPNDKAIERKEEATYNGNINIAKELKNIEISGIKFIGNSTVSNEAGKAGAADATATNLDGFKFINNIVVSTLASGKGFLVTYEASSGYSHNLEISNNLFTTAEGYKADAMVTIDNCYDINVIGNVFENITNGKALHFVDTTKGLSGQFNNINSNVFKNVAENALTINWLSPLPLKFADSIISIEDNEFVQVGGYAIDFGCMNNLDNYKAINILFNEFTNVKSGIKFARVQEIDNIAFNYNVFNDVPTASYIEYNKGKTAAPSVLNAKDNLYLNAGKVITPDAAKMVCNDDAANHIDYASTITSRDEMPKFNTNSTTLEIVCQDTLFVGDKVQATVKYSDKTTNYGVEWKISDENIAIVDENGNIEVKDNGKFTLTATYKFDRTLVATKEFNVVSYTEIKLEFDNDGYLNAGETLDIKATVQGKVTEGAIEWTSSKPEVATVENGKVTAIAEGEATITAKLAGQDVASTYTITVKDLTGMNALLKLLVENNNAVVWNQEIGYCGYEEGFEFVPNNVFGSVNNYFAGQAPKLTENPMKPGADNIQLESQGDQTDMVSLEFITVHDTGSASPSSTARANSNWCTNLNNHGTSWHYTIGNDGIFHQVEDTKITWHAGDGISWGTTTVLRDTGIKADPDLRKRGKVTIKDGFFYVNGQKTPIAIPEGADPNAKVNDTGFVCVVKDGNYHLPTAHVLKDGVVSARGGNNNSIGIETAVNDGTNVYLTWQYVAKHVATLLVKHNLTPERVVFHNSWSNKMCPQTMMRANKTETFLDMVYCEYYVLKNFSDYKIEFISNNPDIIDNAGNVIGHGPYLQTEVSYTIKVTKGNESVSAVCHSTVQGSHIH